MQINLTMEITVNEEKAADFIKEVKKLRKKKGNLYRVSLPVFSKRYICYYMIFTKVTWVCIV